MSEWLKTCEMLLKLAMLGDAKAAIDLRARLEKAEKERFKYETALMLIGEGIAHPAIIANHAIGKATPGIIVTEYTADEMTPPPGSDYVTLKPKTH